MGEQFCGFCGWTPPTGSTMALPTHREREHSGYRGFAPYTYADGVQIWHDDLWDRTRKQARRNAATLGTIGEGVYVGLRYRHPALREVAP